MNLNDRLPNRFYIFLILAGLLLLSLWPALTAWFPLTDQQRLERAWREAGDIGRFQYHTDVVQTIHPHRPPEQCWPQCHRQTLFGGRHD